MTLPTTVDSITASRRPLPWADRPAPRGAGQGGGRFVKLPVDLGEEMERGRLGVLESAILLYLWTRVNPYTGSLVTASSALASVWPATSRRSVGDAVASLRR